MIIDNIAYATIDTDATPKRPVPVHVAFDDVVPNHNTHGPCRIRNRFADDTAAAVVRNGITYDFNAAVVAEIENPHEAAFIDRIVYYRDIRTA
jgi:hypothetical protein